MNKQEKKFIIRIPDNISVIYNKKKNILVLKNALKQKSLKLKIRIFINKSEKIISVSPFTFLPVSNSEKKNIKALQVTTVVLIKQALIETLIFIYKKLKLNGVGFRIFFTETFENKLLTLKLGYSHLIYYKIPNNILINCITKTKLCLFGDSYKTVSQHSALIRKNKVPEPYKGKGILYENETVIIKEGKKV